ncbi:hypothetical protein [Pseudonocardia sp.]|uniref:hypothetical protein n=1 Tax=Pseudonocardia sp. TaxID=60912 RepID=UPI003D14893F
MTPRQACSAGRGTTSSHGYCRRVSASVTPSGRRSSRQHAVAAPLVLATGVGELGVLFSGGVLLGLWLLVSGVLLGRRAVRAAAPAPAPRTEPLRTP